MSAQSGRAPVRHKDKLRLTAVADAYQLVGIPLHRDQLFPILEDRNPGLCGTAMQLSSFLNRNAEAFPNLGDGVHFSKFAELSLKARDSADPRAFVAVGRCAWGDLHDAAKAEAAFSRALELHISDPDGHRGLADIYIAQRRWSEAAGVLKWLQRKYPEDRKVLTRLAACAEGASDWTAAQEYWSLLAERHSRDPGVLLRLGVAAFENDDAEVCAEALQAALAIDDEVAQAHVLLARIAFDSDAPDEAFEHLERALELDPAAVAEQCPGPLLDAFLEWSDDKDMWLGELGRYMHFR